MHDKSVFTDAMWFELSTRLMQEIMPCIKRLDPLHFGLKPNELSKIEKKEWWQDASYWDMVCAQWAANQPSFVKADEMYAVHAQDPISWPYERLAATYGCTVPETKELLLYGASRGCRRDGTPFNYTEAYSRLYASEEQHLKKRAERRSLTAEEKAAKRKRDVFTGRFYPYPTDDPKGLMNELKEQLCAEPTLEEVTRAVEMGIQPLHSDLIVSVKQEAHRPPPKRANDPSLEREGIDSWFPHIKACPNVTLSIRDYKSMTPDEKRERLRNMQRQGEDITLVSPEVEPSRRHLVRHPNGVLRAGTLPEWEMTLPTQQVLVNPIVKWAREETVRNQMKETEWLNPPKEPKMQSKSLALTRGRLRKVERAMEEHYNSQKKRKQYFMKPAGHSKKISLLTK
jgi:hypothetical protein